MPRTKAFNEQEALERAMELFWRQGYHATSVQDLVSALGINRSSLYDTFGDKQQLFERAFAHYRKQNTEGMRAFLNSHHKVRQGLRALFTQAIDATVRDKERKGCFVVNVTTELVPGDEAIHRILAENRRTFEDLFFTYLKAGEERGEIPAGKDLRAIATLLFTLYNGLKVVGKIAPDRRQLQASVEAALGLLD